MQNFSKQEPFRAMITRGLGDVRATVGYDGLWTFRPFDVSPPGRFAPDCGRFAPVSGLFVFAPACKL